MLQIIRAVTLLLLLAAAPFVSGKGANVRGRYVRRATDMHQQNSGDEVMPPLVSASEDMLGMPHESSPDDSTTSPDEPGIPGGDGTPGSIKISVTIDYFAAPTSKSDLKVIESDEKDVMILEGTEAPSNGTTVSPSDEGTMFVTSAPSEMRRRLQEEEEVDQLISNTINFYSGFYTDAFGSDFEELIVGSVVTTGEPVTEDSIFQLTFEAELKFSDVPSQFRVDEVTEAAPTDEYIKDFVQPSGEFFEQVQSVAIKSRSEMLTAAPTMSPTVAPTAEELGTIVDIVAGNPDLSILVELLTQAGLVEILSGEGPFTVFAPTNDAFDALDPETLEAVASDPDLLESVLLYHVVEGTVLSTDLEDEATVATVNGADVTTFTDPPKANDANIVEADILASNGVIHVIDKVLIPPAEETDAPTEETDPPVVETDAPTEEELGTIVDIAVGNPDFSILVELLTQAGLVEVLSGEGPFTVFAPTNDAFDALDPETLEAVASDPDLLESVLFYHVVEGTVLSTDLEDEATVTTINGADVTTFTDPPRVNDANIVEADILASNGVIHVVDKVLIPPAEETDAPSEETDPPLEIAEPTPAPTEAPEGESFAPTTCPGTTANVTGTLELELDEDQDLTEPTADKIVEVAQFILQGLGAVLRDAYGDAIRAFSATVNDSQTALDGNSYPLEIEATIVFTPCAPPADELNEIFVNADYEEILSSFEPSGEDNVFQFLTGDVAYTGETTITP